MTLDPVDFSPCTRSWKHHKCSSIAAPKPPTRDSVCRPGVAANSAGRHCESGVVSLVIGGNGGLENVSLMIICFLDSRSETDVCSLQTVLVTIAVATTS